MSQVTASPIGTAQATSTPRELRFPRYVAGLQRLRESRGVSEPPAASPRDHPPAADNVPLDPTDPLAGIPASPRAADNRGPSVVLPADIAPGTLPVDDQAVGGNSFVVPPADVGAELPECSELSEFQPSQIEDSTSGSTGGDDSTYTAYDLTLPTTRPLTTRQRRGNEPLLTGLPLTSRPKKPDPKSKSPEKTL